MSHLLPGSWPIFPRPLRHLGLAAESKPSMRAHVSMPATRSCLGLPPWTVPL